MCHVILHSPAGESAQDLSAPYLLRRTKIQDARLLLHSKRQSQLKFEDYLIN